jgi:hypothetical protein
MNTFRISFIVTSQQLPTIIGCLVNEVTDFCMEEVKNLNKVKRRNYSSRPSKLEEIFFANIELNETFTTAKLGAIFEKGQYNASSASAFITEKRRAGYIEASDSRGVYKRIK